MSPSHPPDVGTLRLDNDSDQEDIFDSPGKTESPNNATVPGPYPSRHGRHSSKDTREDGLRKELESVKSVNKVIENVIESLERAKGNMNTVHGTVQSASTLLNTWTRILSQTEHNQRLILDPNWQGATQDLDHVENEALMRQQAAERRAADDQARREAAAKRAEEEERRKTAAPSTTRGTRARGRGAATSRLTASSTSNSQQSYVGVGGQGGRGRAGSRVASGIGRGTRGTRGRGLI